MSVHTKARRIKRSCRKFSLKPRKSARKAKERSIPWREVFKEEIAKYSEGGLALRGSRHKENLTQKDLSEALDISQHHISEMENGKRSIGKKMAMRFAKFFKTDYRIFL